MPRGAINDPLLYEETDETTFDPFISGKKRPVIRTSSRGTSQAVGLKDGGTISQVIVGSAAWVALPDIARDPRHAMAIQNNTDVTAENVTLMIQHVISAAPPDVGVIFGMLVKAGQERFYSLQKEVIIYGRILEDIGAGTVKIDVEEIG